MGDSLRWCEEKENEEYLEWLETRQSADNRMLSVEIPSNATNGDVMQSIFPNCEAVDAGEDYVNVYLKGWGIPNAVDKDWWNARYEGDNI